MNPETNQFERIAPDRSVPAGFIEFAIGSIVIVNNYEFKIIRVSANRLHLEPVGAVCHASNAKRRD